MADETEPAEAPLEDTNMDEVMEHIVQATPFGVKARKVVQHGQEGILIEVHTVIGVLTFVASVDGATQVAKALIDAVNEEISPVTKLITPKTGLIKP